MADKKITQFTAADVADLGALTTMLAGAIDVTTTPLTRKIGLGKIATWLATIGLAASTVLAQGVTVTQGTITDQAAGYAQTVTWNDAADTFIAQTLDVTDTASAAGSLLARWRVGGVDQFTVSRAGALVLAGTASFTGGTFTTALTSTTAQATLGAMAATQGSFYASTVSGATLQGYGTTADVTLKNRAGTDVLKIGPNTTAAVFAGAVTSTGDLTVGASALVVTAATGALAITGDLSVSRASAGASVTLGVANTSATAASAAYMSITTNATAVADASFIFYSAGLYTWAMGVDASDSAAFVISRSTELGTNNAVHISAANTVTLASSLAITGALTGATSVISASPTGGLGYGTGAGGAQTQATNKQTGVTSNTITTAITLNAENLAAATTTAFTFTNSAIAATDTVLVTHESAGTSGAYTLNAFPAAGSAVISLRNNTAGGLAEAIVLRVTVIKSVSA